MNTEAIHFGVQAPIPGTVQNVSVSACDNVMFCDTSMDIDDVTCPECLKFYIKKYDSLWRDLEKKEFSKETLINDLRLHIKKIQRKLNETSKSLEERA